VRVLQPAERPAGDSNAADQDHRTGRNQKPSFVHWLDHTYGNRLPRAGDVFGWVEAVRLRTV
jgi:hypothetical protein